MEGSVDAKLEAVRSWQDECDLRVDLAEELWGQRRFSDSIVQYNAALAIAKTHNDLDKVGMIHAGKACVMMHAGEPLKACVKCYEESLAIATALKNPRQMDFVKHMIGNTEQQWHQINGKSQADGDSDADVDAAKSTVAAAVSSSAESQECEDCDAIDVVIRCFRKSPADPASSGTASAPARAESMLAMTGTTYDDDSATTTHNIRTAVWDIPYADAMKMIGRSFPAGVTPVAARACLAGNIPHFTAQFASCMRISASQVEVSVGDPCIEVRVPFSMLVTPMHAAFDVDADGFLSYKECQQFLTDIHDVQWDEYKQFCDEMSIDPDTGLNVNDLYTFYSGHDTSVL